MTRPDSKIMNLASEIIESGATPVTMSKSEVKRRVAGGKLKVVAPAVEAVAQAVKAAKVPRTRKAVMPELTKAEKKARITALKEAHKLGRAPLSGVEELRKALWKDIAQAKKEYAAATKTHNAKLKAWDKELAVHEKKIEKYTGIYTKATEKLNAEIAKLA